MESDVRIARDYYGVFSPGFVFVGVADKGSGWMVLEAKIGPVELLRVLGSWR